jgi:hypothetical protein
MKRDVLRQGSHHSARQPTKFLCEESVGMIHKGQWLLLPSDMILTDTNLRLIPLRVAPQRDRRPHTIYDYSFFFVNLDTTPLALE